MAGAVAAIERLGGRMDSVGPLCVGLDPVVERLPPAVIAGGGGPAELIERFCSGVIEAVAGSAAAVKPQSACFERFGWAGVRALERVVGRARAAGLWVVLDGKRGDIGISAEHYARAAADMGAEAATVNAYLGPSGVEPFLDAGLAVFCLVRTSNPDSDAVQGLEVSGGGRVAERVGGMVAGLGAGWRSASSGLSAAGAVVGATKPAEFGSLRAAMPDQVFLMPGVGAQGGEPGALAGAVRPGAGSAGASGVLATASRSVIYPAASAPGGWASAIEAAARRTADDIGAVLASVLGA